MLRLEEEKRKSGKGGGGALRAPLCHQKAEEFGEHCLCATESSREGAREMRGTTRLSGDRHLAKETSAVLEHTATLLGEREMVTGVTIDALNARELDDAFSLERTRDGHMLHLSVADVGGAIPLSLAPLVDRAAYIQAFACYSAHEVQSLLPPPLAGQDLSLIEGQPRPALTFSIPLDVQLQPGELQIRPTCFINQRRLCYEDVDEDIECPRTELARMLHDAFDVAHGLLCRRRSHGALAYFDVNMGWATTEEGGLIQQSAARGQKARLIVREWMILLNHMLALYCAQRDIPILYRNHAAKVIAPERSTLLRLFETFDAGDQSFARTARQTIDLALERAFYAPTVSGHFGLNISAYVHMSSPLRRYADLVNQRILHASLTGKPSPYSQTDLRRIAHHLNQREDALKLARRELLPPLEERVGRVQGDSVPAPSTLSLGSLSAKQFHRALRIAIQQAQVLPELEQEIRRRLQHQLLRPNDLYLLVFGCSQQVPVWCLLKRDVLLWIQDHACYAVNLLEMGFQHQRWKRPLYEFHEVRARNHGMFRGRVQICAGNQQLVSSWQAATRKSVVKQAVSAELVAILAGNTEIVPRYDNVVWDSLTGDGQGNSPTLSEALVYMEQRELWRGQPSQTAKEGLQEKVAIS